MSNVGKWHKPADRMPVIGVGVVAAYPDARHVVLHAYSEGDGWYWTDHLGRTVSDPEFWLEENLP